jgi:hypothetical protein
MAFACELESMAAVAAACSRLFQIAQDHASTRPKGCWVSTSCAASCPTRPTSSLRELTAQQPAEAADGSLVHDAWLKQRLGRGQINPVTLRTYALRARYARASRVARPGRLPGTEPDSPDDVGFSAPGRAPAAQAPRPSALLPKELLHVAQRFKGVNCDAAAKGGHDLYGFLQGAN